MTKKKLLTIALRSMLAIVMALILLLLIVQLIPWVNFEEKNQKEQLIEPYLHKQAEAIARAYSIDKGIASQSSYLSMYKDHWDRELHIAIKGDVLCLTSAGPDGIFETEDDITVEERIPK